MEGLYLVKIGPTVGVNLVHSIFCVVADFWLPAEFYRPRFGELLQQSVVDADAFFCTGRCFFPSDPNIVQDFPKHSAVRRKSSSVVMYMRISNRRTPDIQSPIPTTSVQECHGGGRAVSCS